MPRTGEYGDWLEELKSRIDIADVVSRYVPLEQKGRNFWGRCPFHHEKTPSFAVNPERQAYKCFGCGASGDAIKFVEEMESANFMDAVKILAERVGYTLPDFSKNKDGDIEKRKEKKQRLLAAVKEAARFYYASLKNPSAREANEYIAKRQIPPAVAKNFGLGASPGWEDLVKHLAAKGFLREEMHEAGLCYEKNGKWYDSLACRLIFPIIDNFGNVVAFGGRELQESGFAKYKNTTQTMLFDKSKTLYAVNLVKKLRQEETVNSLIIVEGYMDTVSLHAAGFCNVVASMGTSLTVMQAQMIKRMVDKVYISYDGDAAGQKAALRGLDILRGEGLSVYVVELPEGMDPDDVVKKKGASAYQALLNEALPLTDYKLKILKRLFDLNKAEEKRKYVLRALAVISNIPNFTEQEDYIKQIKTETGFTYESLKRDLELLSSEGAPVPVADNASYKADSGADKAMRFILYEMLQKKHFAFENGDLSSFTYNKVHRIVYEYANEKYKKGQDISFEELNEFFNDTDRSELERILNVPLNELDGDREQKYFYDCVDTFRLKGLELQEQILQREAENETDGKKRAELYNRITAVIQKQQQLK